MNDSICVKEKHVLKPSFQSWKVAEVGTRWDLP